MMLKRFGILSIGLTLFWVVGIATAFSSVNIKDVGAIGDGKTVNTASIQKAVDSASAAGGGTVIIPAGTFVSGPIFLKSNIEIRLEPGAILKGSTDYNDYPVVDSRWEGVERKQHASLITGIGLENVAITGNGVLDGSGSVWWRDSNDDSLTDQQKEELHKLRTAYPRPYLIALKDCKRVRIEGVKLTNSPSWTVHPIYCEDVAISGITIDNPGNSPNTDGINPDSCKSVRISNCLISCGDDCITLKSGKDADGRRVGKPTEDVTVTNCVVKSGHGGIVIGSEMSGGVRNVAISNCIFDGTQRGIRIKSQRGRGGVVENLSFNNIVMNKIKEAAISVTMFYSGGDIRKAESVDDGTPVFRSISISNVKVNGAESAASFEGLSEMHIRDIILTNFTGNARSGISCTNAEGIELKDIELSVEKGPGINCELASDIRVSNASLATASPDPLIDLVDTKDSWITGCPAYHAQNLFLKVEGADSANIVLSGNNPSIDEKKISAAPGIVKMNDH